MCFVEHFDWYRLEGVIELVRIRFYVEIVIAYWLLCVSIKYYWGFVVINDFVVINNNAISVIVVIVSVTVVIVNSRVIFINISYCY